MKDCEFVYNRSSNFRRDDALFFAYAQSCYPELYRDVCAALESTEYESEETFIFSMATDCMIIIAGSDIDEWKEKWDAWHKRV